MQARQQAANIGTPQPVSGRLAISSEPPFHKAPGTAALRFAI